MKATPIHNSYCVLNDETWQVAFYYEEVGLYLLKNGFKIDVTSDAINIKLGYRKQIIRKLYCQ